MKYIILTIIVTCQVQLFCMEKISLLSDQDDESEQYSIEFIIQSIKEARKKSHHIFNKIQVFRFNGNSAVWRGKGTGCVSGTDMQMIKNNNFCYIDKFCYVTQNGQEYPLGALLVGSGNESLLHVDQRFGKTFLE